jgi:hypothetical protein
MKKETCRLSAQNTNIQYTHGRGKQTQTEMTMNIKVHEYTHRQARNLYFLKEIGLENVSDFFT